MTKQELRQKMRGVRATISAKDRSRQEEAIRQAILRDPVWKETEWVYPYVSYGTEVDTRTLIQYMLTNPVGGHMLRIAVPRVEGRNMDFYEIRDMDALAAGFRGIYEPAAFCPQVEIREGVMLIPGLAFDQTGRRLGYGGGYYDRYLAEHTSHALKRYALAFEQQIVEKIPAEPHDLPVDRIVTSQITTSQFAHSENIFSS